MRQRLLGGDKRDQLGHILFEEAHHVELCQTIKGGVDRIGGALTAAARRLAQHPLRLAHDEHFKVHAHLQKQFFLAVVKLIESGFGDARVRRETFQRDPLHIHAHRVTASAVKQPGANILQLLRRKCLRHMLSPSAIPLLSYSTDLSASTISMPRTFRVSSS